MGFTGVDTFTYRATNGSELSNVATVTITVASSRGNAPPVAVNDSYSVAEGTELIVGAPGVLANDTDAEGAPLTAVLVDDVDNGTLTLNADGSFRYTPRNGFTGTDRFRYQARDGSGSSAPATVTITVAAVNDPPVAAADSYATNEGPDAERRRGQRRARQRHGRRRQPLDGRSRRGASSGTLTLQRRRLVQLRARRRLQRHHDVHVSSRRRHRAQQHARPSRSPSTPSTIAPTAQPDSYTTAEDTPLSVGGNGVLGNDTDPDGDTLTAAARQQRHERHAAAQRQRLVRLHAARELQRHDELHVSRARRVRAERARSRSRSRSRPSTTRRSSRTRRPTTATEGVTYRYTLTASDPDGNDADDHARRRFRAGSRSRRPQRSPARRRDADVGDSRRDDERDGRHRTRRHVAVSDHGHGRRQSRRRSRPIPEQTATESTPFDLDLATFVTDSDTAASAR